AMGTTQQFKATGTFSDNSTQDLTTTAVWSSDNTGVATISNTAGSQGLATPVAIGTANIAATSGAISGSTQVTVTAAALVSIAVSPQSPAIALGLQQPFTATGTYTDNTTQDVTTTVVWSSSAANIAVISNTTGTQGMATSAGIGVTTITATSGSISNS